MAKKVFSKDLILKSAYEMALEVGVKKITMRKLASRIGSSVMPIYEKFSSKDELLDAISVFVEDYPEIDDVTIYDRYNHLLYYGLTYPDFYLNIIVPNTSHSHSMETLCKICYILKKDPRLNHLIDKDLLILHSRIDVFLTGIIFVYQRHPQMTRIEQYERLKTVLQQVIDGIILGFMQSKSQKAE